MARSPKPITPAQIKAIHTMARQLGMFSEAGEKLPAYIDLIARHGEGVITSTQMLSSQASAAIRELEDRLGTKTTQAKTAARQGIDKAKAAAKRPPTPNSQGNVVAMATPGQRDLINNLLAEINWHAHGGFAPWLKKYYGLTEVKTKEQAQKVINGMMGLKKHGHAKKSRFPR